MANVERSRRNKEHWPQSGEHGSDIPSNVEPDFDEVRVL
jgi:hypothetical protein